MRAGVVAVLRAQTHPWCRQEALAVASAMVAFLGPAWLLGGPPLQVWARHIRTATHTNRESCLKLKLLASGTLPAQCRSVACRWVKAESHC